MSDYNIEQFSNDCEGNGPLISLCILFTLTDDVMISWPEDSFYEISPFRTWFTDAHIMNFVENIEWSVLGKQNEQGKEIYYATAIATLNDSAQFKVRANRQKEDLLYVLK